MPDIISKNIESNILTVTFQHANAQNPMSRALEIAIIAVCADVANDDEIKAVVFTGGSGRSFCAGGDFNEVSLMNTAIQVEEWIDRVIALYIAVLNLNKPTVAAIDEYAIGIGFQLALACDFRLVTPDAKLIMWELKHGVACTIGGYMLERFVGRAAMMDLIYNCEPVDLDWAVTSRLTMPIIARSALLYEAQALVAKIAAYPEIAFRSTKQSVNREFIDGLRAIVPVSKRVHVAAFKAEQAAPHFKRVLKRE